jgi:hypothetical protein
LELAEGVGEGGPHTEVWGNQPLRRSGGVGHSEERDEERGDEETVTHPPRRGAHTMSKVGANNASH